MKEKLPETFLDLKDAYPEVWRAFNQVGDACHEAGPLDDRSRRLVKLALAVAAGLEGGTHSAVRNALASGITAEEIEHVVVLAVTTIGWPATVRGWTWVQDVLADEGDERDEGEAGE
jgi:alkylhydroperoxidase/carboxymuconolactone decarboxylase family protein YurZ